MNRTSTLIMTESPRNYLVFMMDESDSAFFWMFVRAARAVDAAAHAQLYREEDEVREDGYKVLCVVAAENLEDTLKYLKAYEGEEAPRYDLQQFDLSEIYFACD